MLYKVVILPFILLLSSCHIGDNVKNAEPVRTGGGISVIIELYHVQSWPGGSPSGTPFQQVRGELLYLDEMTMTVNGPAIAQFAYGQIRSAEFPTVSKFDFATAPTELLDELKLYSRYPVTIDDTLLSSLLEAYGQDSLYVFK